MKFYLPNICFFVMILFLTRINSNELKSISSDKIENTKANINKENLSLIQIYKSQDSNNSVSDNFEKLLEEIFSSEDETENYKLSKEYKNLYSNIYSTEEDVQISNIKKFDREENSFVFIDEKNNEEKIIEDFCSQEKNSIKEKIRFVENKLIYLKNNEKEQLKEKEALESKIKENENNLKIKNEIIQNQLNQKHSIKNSTHIKNEYRNNTEIITLLDSLIILVNSYYENLENSKIETKEKFNKSKIYSDNFIEIIKKTEKYKDYSLKTLFSEIMNKNFKITEKSINNSNNNDSETSSGEIKKKIMDSLEKIKKSYVDKQKIKNENLEQEINLIEKELENNKNFVNLLNDENLNYNNKIIFLDKSLESNQISLSLYNKNFEKLKDVLNDLNRICS